MVAVVTPLTDTMVVGITLPDTSQTRWQGARKMR